MAAEAPKRLTLRTANGPVGLRQARTPVTLELDGGGKKAIKKDWLKDQKAEGAYQRAVKQAMLVAVEEINLADAEDPVFKKHSPTDVQQFQARLQQLLAGRQKISLLSTKKKTLQKLDKKEDRKRETLIKFSKKCLAASCNRRVRSFIIDNGELLIYRSHHPNAVLKDHYKLKDATCFYETRSTAQVPKWDEGYQARIRVDCKERMELRKNPLYLYSADPQKLQRWRRAFTLAKVLIAENDRRALKVCIGRATSGALTKAWEALVTYYGEIMNTKSLVKHMAMRLMKVDLSRGWTKLRLVQMKREEEKRKRKEQQIWAARFMSEKLAKVGSQNAKSAADVRESVITRIQQRFRRYREEMIFDRAYPLGSSMMSRVQQAKLGQTMDFAMQAMKGEEAIRLCLSGAALEKWGTDKDVIKAAKPTYSEVNIPSGTVCVHVSDNLSCLSFSSYEKGMESYMALSKADWSKFINLDRISSIILHTDPVPGAGLAEGNQDSGVWCTINGPRICWDKCLRMKSDGVQFVELVPAGAADGLQVPRALSKLEALKWVTLKVTLGSANLQLLKHEAAAGLVGDETGTAPARERTTVAVLHVLGWSFTSNLASGETPTYNFTAQAAVPVSSDDFVALDAAEISLEIFEVTMAEAAPGVTAAPKTVLVLVGSQKLTSIYEASEDGLSGTALAVKLDQQQGPLQYQLHLTHPASTKADPLIFDPTAELTLEAQVTMSRLDDKTKASHAVPLPGNPPAVLSPELCGGGVATTLFTSHRGAWYDPELGPGKFRIDHVANFVELSLGSLRFPSDDKVKIDDASALFRIRATAQGFSTASPGLHRPKAEWAQVLGPTMGDPTVIKYNGHRLFVPLPPGCWGSENLAMRRIQIEVLRYEEVQSQPQSYADFVASAGKTSTLPGVREAVIYHGSIIFDHLMTVDRQKPLSIFLAKPGSPPLEVNVYTNAVTDPNLTTDGVLSVDFSLRDRDYVKAMTGQAGEKRSLCVGDKAMLVVAEPLLYPQDSQEFRKRFCSGVFDIKKNKPGQEWAGGRGAPLREPCLSSEYAESGLGDTMPRVPFKQSFIPTFCTDIMPHKYVLPLSEKEFLDRHLPGFFPRIVDDLVANKEGPVRSVRGRSSGVIRPVVKFLTHVSRHVPVTLLATYADGTCDIEVAPEFLQSWERNQSRKFVLPGSLVFQRAATINSTARAVLKRVPTLLLHAVHYTSVNVYDAAFKSTDDVLRGPPPTPDFNPRVEDMRQAGKKFAIAAGPLPVDATSAACQYEWSIRVRAPNEYEMHQFVAMLRRCVRMDHYQQAQKMQEYQRRTTDTRVPQVTNTTARTVVGGQLDVVLVEARRLKPMTSLLQHLISSDPATLSYQSLTKPPEAIRCSGPVDETFLPQLVGTTSGEAPKGTPEGSNISTFVNFRMLHNREVIPYKGQKLQQSPVLSGTDSPCWASKEELQVSGGWTFRTGNIDPDRLPDLIIDFEVMQAGVGFATRIGAIQLPVTQRNFLTNPNEPFKNLWLPLVSIKDGRPVANPTGEIHIMTRWLPAEKLQVLADGSQKQQLSVRASFLKELWPRVCAQRLREPIYNIDAQYLNYNPNLVRPRPGAPKDLKRKTPEAPKDHIRRHAEELANAVPYVECLERRQLQAWDEFEQYLASSETQGVRLGERRLIWLETQDAEHLQQLTSLIQRGIPSARRERIWAELTLASRVLERDGAGAASRPQGGDSASLAKAAELEYQRLLERGGPQNSDAMRQLQEDAFSLASWESSVVPEVLDLHLRRLKKAQNVCTALMACPDSGIAYCESLLVLAFFLLLPQGCKEERFAGDGSSTFLSESSVFWLLYTLICTRVNGTYREYYGTPVPAEFELSRSPSLCAGSGAMHDVQLLECCLAYHENALWQHLTAVGFHLSTVFYGAFMRLFATYMPTASVFRFWDVLFAQSTDPKAQPHARAYLIDLAFGVLRMRKVELLACESALEIRSLILGTLGALYDTSTVVDITILTDAFLWGGGGFSGGKIGHLWTQREDLFRAVNHTIMEQNEVLKQLTHLIPLRVANISQASQDTRTQGVTTKDLLKEVLPVIQQSMENLRARGPPRFFAMYRPMPLAARVLCESSIDKAWKVFQSSLRMHPQMPPVPFMVGPPPAALQAGKMTAGLEPFDIVNSDLATVLDRDIPAWGSHATAIWNAFTNSRHRTQLGHMGMAAMGNTFGNALGNMSGPYTDNSMSSAYPSNAMGADMQYATQRGGLLQTMMTKVFGTPELETELNARSLGREGHQEERMSLNDFFIALICASRGTLGEKAAALFNIYSYSDPRGKDTLHWTQVSRLARSICNVQTDGGADLIGRALAPPEPESDDAKQNVLRFTVMSNYPTKNTVLGDVFVQSLSNFIGYNVQDAQDLIYNIWGSVPEGHRSRASVARRNVAPENDGGNLQRMGGVPADLVCVGELCMSISWTPKSIRKPEEGQLCIWVKYIKFFPLYLSDFYKMNPWIVVRMCKEEISQGIPSRKWVDIPRWDPRGVVGSDRQASWLTTHGAYGGTIKFDQTMREGLLGHGDSFSHHWRDGKNMGYESGTQQWQWNEVWGRQLSLERMTILPEFVRISQRKNVMDIQGARLIVAGILQRCMLNVTNRQAITIADSVFSRQGAVPGILEAILTVAMPEETLEDGTCLQQVKDRLNKADVKFVDVTRQVLLEHEKQVAHNGGNLNLFSLQYMARDEGGLDVIPVNISKDMLITDPFPDKPKVLWVRYVRSGDAERLTKAVRVEANGDIVGPQESIEVPIDLVDSWPHTKITKEEFVSCLLSSPLLGESLRRLGSCDHVLHAKRSIPLEVTIMDPHRQEEDQQFDDVINVQQSILLEVWDSDVVSKDFLGEAWLPPLSMFGPRMKDLVLPLQKADYSEDAENGPSREDHKDVGDEAADPNRKITGELYISVSWKFPIFEDKGLDQDIDTWLDGLETTHKLEPGTLAKYSEKIKTTFITVQGIVDFSPPMVSAEGVVDKQFFEILGIKTKKEKTPFEKFFKDNILGEDVKSRADVQEKLHTGLLKIRIDRARGLRRSDAKRFRDCDPQVSVWLRNDVKNAWRKKPFMRTKVVTNNRNPVWQFEQERPLFTGAYEARFAPPEEGFMAEVRNAMRSAKQKRYREEDRQINALKRFGHQGLKIRFFDSAERPTGAAAGVAGAEGENHGVEVFIGDSIREFKAKLTAACEKEAAHWKAVRGETSEEAMMFSGVNIGYKHLVMVFVPSAKVQRLYAQKLHEGAEYKRAYQQAWNDPSCWQPLDPARAFAQYGQFGFGRKQPQMLRVVEATESYKVQNLRYKIFEEEMARKGFQDTNDNTKCFGWAKYRHQGDGPSAEWRPAFISRGEGSDPTVKVKWIFEPWRPSSMHNAGNSLLRGQATSTTLALDNAGRVDPEPEILARTDVLLAPRCPKFDDYVHPDHRELLEQAKLLRSSGKSDFEIRMILNKLLDDKWATERGTRDESSRPPPIEVDTIRAFMQRREEQEAKAADERATMAYAKQ